MGFGNSKLSAEKKQRHQPTGYPRAKRNVVRKVRPIPIAPPLLPYQRKPRSPYSYGSRCVSPQLSGYGQSPLSYPYSLLKPYSNYFTRLYNNYSSYPLQNYGSQPYMALNQALLIPPQVPESPVLIAPNQGSSTIVPPSLSPSYPAVGPYSSGPAEYQPIYNNVAMMAPTSTGLANPIQLNPSFYQSGGSGLFTDWTGGGKISPGFLGPPI